MSTKCVFAIHVFFNFIFQPLMKSYAIVSLFKKMRTCVCKFFDIWEKILLTMNYQSQETKTFSSCGFYASYS